jgi:hypothetical protein
VRRLEWIVLGLLTVGAVTFWLLPAQEEPPEVKRLQAETDRVFTEIGKVSGGIRGPNKEKLERLLKELDSVYEETTRLVEKVEEGVNKGTGYRHYQDQLQNLQMLRARQRAILVPFWQLQWKEKNSPSKRSR